MTETFNLSLEQAHAYEDLFVPALFGQWVPTLLRHAARDARASKSSTWPAAPASSHAPPPSWSALRVG